MDNNQQPEGESQSETALLPKSIFPHEVKAGDECKFRVVHVYGDEIEVEYESSEKGEDKDEYDRVDNKIDMMAGNGMPEEMGS